MGRRWLVFWLLFWLVLPSSTGQELPLPHGRFLEDSMRLGDTVHFSLTYRHDKSLEVLFPDSGAIPAQFELLSKRYFPTQTRHGFSLDSAVYVLRSFELDTFQSLQLPVFILKNGDSTLVFSTSDSVALVQLVNQVNEPLQLAENNIALPLPQQFNYLYFLGALAIAALVVLLLVLLFGKSLRRRYERYLATSRFRAFQSRFNSLLRRFGRYHSVQILEEAVTLWKNYLTDLEEIPINSFTTKEIAEYYNQEELSEVLKLCDRAIYGNIIENQEKQTTDSLRFLGQFSVDRYHQLQNQPTDAPRATA